LVCSTPRFSLWKRCRLRGAGQFTKSIFDRQVVWWTQPNSSGQSLKFEEATGALIVVPEPSTIAIAAIGTALAGLRRYRRQKSECV